MLGPENDDDKEVVILGRIVRWTEKDIEYEADPRHRVKMLEYFGFGGSTKAGGANGYREDKVDGEGDEFLDKAEAKEFRGLAAR
eukprot:3912922-Karenia_brevis.AAC.1